MSAQFIILSPSENSGRKSERRAELKGRKPALHLPRIPPSSQDSCLLSGRFAASFSDGQPVSASVGEPAAKTEFFHQPCEVGLTDRASGEAAHTPSVVTPGMTFPA